MWRFLNLSLLACLIFITGISAADDEGTANRQSQFMAVYLFHFASFIQWPDQELNDSADFKICLLGQPAISRHAAKLDGKIIKSKNKTIRIIEDVAINNIASCQILYLSKTSPMTDSTLHGALVNTSVLLVSDQSDFANNGGDIGYFIQNNKLRIAINIKNTEHKKLAISSKLLRLAKIIGGN